MSQDYAKRPSSRSRVYEGLRTCPYCTSVNTVKQREGLRGRLQPDRTVCDECDRVFSV